MAGRHPQRGAATRGRLRRGEHRHGTGFGRPRSRHHRHRRGQGPPGRSRRRAGALALMAEALRRAEADAGAPAPAAAAGRARHGQRGVLALRAIRSGCSARRSASRRGTAPSTARSAARRRCASCTRRRGASPAARARWPRSAAARRSTPCRGRRRPGIALPWTPHDPDRRPPRAAITSSRVARRLGLDEPIRVYPLYENATPGRLGPDPGAGPGGIGGAVVLPFRGRPPRNRIPGSPALHAPAEIATPSPGNRPIAWPYLKLMVANPAGEPGRGGAADQPGARPRRRHSRPPPRACLGRRGGGRAARLPARATPTATPARWRRCWRRRWRWSAGRRGPLRPAASSTAASPACRRWRGGGSGLPEVRRRRSPAA